MKKLTPFIIVGLFLPINQVNTQTFVNYITANTSTTLCNNWVNDIAIDSQGNEWFATIHGVSKFDGTTWTTYTTANGLIDDLISSITIDAKGNKWFGAFWGGVSKFDGSEWHNYTLGSHAIDAIATDAEGNIWFGTNGDGVWKYNGKTMKTYRIADGLVSDHVSAIAIDAEGNKWFGTDSGVSELSGEGATEVKPLVINNQLNLYPNPVQDVLYIDLSGITGMLEVSDISGKSVLHKEIPKNNSSIDVSVLGNGIYIIKVFSGNQIFTGKIEKY